jgi:hypothetical protein
MLLDFVGPGQVLRMPGTRQNRWHCALWVGAVAKTLPQLRAGGAGFNRQLPDSLTGRGFPEGVERVMARVAVGCLTR